MKPSVLVYTENRPITVVIFGCTGDLAQKKLLPALFELYLKKSLAKSFTIVGFGRRDMDHEQYRQFVEIALKKNSKSKNKKALGIFLKKVVYFRGAFDSIESFKNLNNFLAEQDSHFGGCSDKIFYLAVPPEWYGSISTHLSSSGLMIPCGGVKGFSRILIEKPFGNDTSSARALNRLLGRLFKEEQIFRIDHYLAKEPIQDIMTFRFSNALFEAAWNSDFIEKIEINLFEKNDIAGRGSFYDKVGALKDVGQNHMLQMLALLAMERPLSFGSEFFSRARADVIKALRLTAVARAQYRGYTDEDGVNKNSSTETFFSVKAEVKTARWNSVPFILTSGKAFPESKTEIIVTFKDTCFTENQNVRDKSANNENLNNKHQNKLIFGIHPKRTIDITFISRVDGLVHGYEERRLAITKLPSFIVAGKSADAYEKVLFDAINGDRLLFAGTDEVEYSWKAIGNLIKKWKSTPMHLYRKNNLEDINLFLNSKNT